MNKLFILLLFLLVSMVQQPVLAQEAVMNVSDVVEQALADPSPEEMPEPDTTTPTMAVANVNVYEIEHSVSGDTYNVSFTIQNDSGVQPGVRYGLELYSDTSRGFVLADEYITDEELTLAAGAVVSRTISFTPEVATAGDYSLVLVAKNESGFPFAYIPVTTITLTPVEAPLVIDLDSCYLTTPDSSVTKQYRPFDTAALDAETEILVSNCAVKNTTAAPITVKPQYLTKFDTTIGEVVQAEAGDYDAITFAPNQTTVVSSVIPTKNLSSGVYTVALTYGNSNPVTYRYVLWGVEAQIQNVYLDAASYEAGDAAEVTFAWSGMSDPAAAVASGEGKEISQLAVSVTLKDSAGTLCGELEVTSLDMSSPKAIVTVPVTANCVRPIVSFSVTDAELGLVGASAFTVTETPTSLSSGDVIADQIINEDSPRTTIYVLAILLGLAVIVLLVLYRRRQSNSEEPMVPPTLSLLVGAVLVGGVLFGFGHTASAATLFVQGEGAFDTPQNGYWITVNLNKSSYLANETINISGNVSYTYQSGSILIEHRLNGAGAYIPMFNGYAGSPSFFSSSLTAPAALGAYFVKNYGQDNNAGYVKVATDINFSVVPGPAACADGADNDGDGKTDYPADPGCQSISDANETDPSCRWQAAGYDQRIRLCNAVTPGFTACSNPHPGGSCGPWEGNQCPGGAVVGGDATGQVNGSTCANYSSKYDNFEGEAGTCGAPTLRVACTLNPPASAPGGLSAVAGSCGTGYIDISWNSVAGATGYEIEVDGTVISTGAIRSYTHSNLGVGSAHSYRVRAVNGDGASSWSGLVNRNAPSACATADLISSAVSITGSGHTQGNPITLSGTVRNSGAASTGVGFTNVFKYQWNGTSGAWQSFAGNTAATGALASGATHTHTVSFTPAQTGTLYIQHCVDSGNVVDEGSSEAGNCRVSSGAAVNVAPTVDLQFR